MTAYSTANKIKSGATLCVVFPLLTVALVAAAQPIPILGGLAYAAVFFSAPVMLIGIATGHFFVPSSPTTFIALLIHYPILGFVAGYILPFELSPNRACVKHIALRYGLLVLVLGSIGLALGLYAVAHDS